MAILFFLCGSDEGLVFSLFSSLFSLLFCERLNFFLFLSFSITNIVLSITLSNSLFNKIEFNYSILTFFFFCHSPFLVLFTLFTLFFLCHSLFFLSLSFFFFSLSFIRFIFLFFFSLFVISQLTWQSALHEAARWGYFNCVCLLISAGADIHLKTVEREKRKKKERERDRERERE